MRWPSATQPDAWKSRQRSPDSQRRLHRPPARNRPRAAKAGGATAPHTLASRTGACASTTSGSRRACARRLTAWARSRRGCTTTLEGGSGRAITRRSRWIWSFDRAWLTRRIDADCKHENRVVSGLFGLVLASSANLLQQPGWRFGGLKAYMGGNLQPSLPPWAWRRAHFALRLLDGSASAQTTCHAWGGRHGILYLSKT
jgi:hypothetical protein